MHRSKTLFKYPYTLGAPSCRQSCYRSERPLRSGIIYIVRQCLIFLQKFVSRVFREVCGVGKKGEWPDSSIIRVKEITQEQYLTPRFDGLIKDASNQHLISVVARKAEMDLRVLFSSLLYSFDVILTRLS